jgi:hypothetical protein
LTASAATSRLTCRLPAYTDFSLLPQVTKFRQIDRQKTGLFPYPLRRFTPEISGLNADYISAFFLLNTQLLLGKR